MIGAVKFARKVIGMFWQFEPRRRSPGSRLKLWGGMVLAVGLLLLLVQLVIILSWFGGAVALVGLVMVMVGALWEDLRRRRRP